MSLDSNRQKPWSIIHYHITAWSTVRYDTLALKKSTWSRGQVIIKERLEASTISSSSSKCWWWEPKRDLEAHQHYSFIACPMLISICQRTYPVHQNSRVEVEIVSFVFYTLIIRILKLKAFFGVKIWTCTSTVLFFLIHFFKMCV